jgi:single-stranded DNA-binding protein
MQVYCNISTTIEKKTSKNGKEYFQFRAAENNGRDENKTTQWYDVRAFIEELDGDLLSKGMFVLITGRLVVDAFLKRDGTPGASATIMANSVQPVEKKQKPAPEDAEAARNRDRDSAREEQGSDVPF